MLLKLVKINLFRCLAVFCICGIGMAANSQASEHDCSIELLNGERPNEISFDLIPSRIFDISENESAFKLQFYFSYSYDVSKEIPDCEFLGDEYNTIFDPRVEFMNADRLERIEDYKVYFSDGNTVSVETKYDATFHGEFDFTLFPFDQQSFPIEVMVYYPKAELQFLKQQSSLDLTNFRVIDWTPKNSDVKMHSEVWDGLEYEKLTFGISLQRNGGSVGIRYFLPLAFVTIIGLLALLLPRSQIEARLTTQTGALVTILALLIVYDSKLPDLSYLTIADGALLLSLFLVFLSCCWSILSYWIYQSVE